MNYLRLQKANRIARSLFRKYYQKFPEHLTPKERKQYRGGVSKHIGMFRKTKVFCSRYCCGNPRRHFQEKTTQEKKSDEDFNQQLEQLKELKK